MIGEATNGRAWRIDADGERVGEPYELVGGRLDVGVLVVPGQPVPTDAEVLALFGGGEMTVSVGFALDHFDPELVALLVGRRWPLRRSPLYPHEAFGWTRRSTGRPVKHRGRRYRRG